MSCLISCHYIGPLDATFTGVGRDVPKAERPPLPGFFLRAGH